MELTAEVLNRLAQIFQANGWSVQAYKCKDRVVFDQVCKLLAQLSSDEQDLILDLLEDFLCVEFYNYEIYLKEAILKLRSDAALIDLV